MSEDAHDSSPAPRRVRRPSLRVPIDESVRRRSGMPVVPDSVGVTAVASAAVVVVRGSTAPVPMQTDAFAGAEERGSEHPAFGAEEQSESESYYDAVTLVRGSSDAPDDFPSTPPESERPTPPYESIRITRTDSLDEEATTVVEPPKQEAPKPSRPPRITIETATTPGVGRSPEDIDADAIVESLGERLTAESELLGAPRPAEVLSEDEVDFEALADSDAEMPEPEAGPDREAPTRPQTQARPPVPPPPGMRRPSMELHGEKLPPPPPEPVVHREAPKPASEPPPPRRAWFETFFDEDYLRTVRPPTPAAVRRECDFIESQLGLKRGATVLDVGCGTGAHAIELARRGYVVTAVDLSEHMLRRARVDAEADGVPLKLVHGDIRLMAFETKFDAVLCWGTTFGYFDDDVNRRVMELFHSVLKPMGVLLVDVTNRDFVIGKQPNLVWFEGDQCVCIEETSFNFITSRLLVKRTVIRHDGHQYEHFYSIRLYSLHELGQLMHNRGFRVLRVSGATATPGVFFGADSPRTLVLAERRVMPHPVTQRQTRKIDSSRPTGQTPAPPKAIVDGDASGTDPDEGRDTTPED